MKTNFEIITQSIKVFAKWLDNHITCMHCPLKGVCNVYSVHECADAIEGWLKSPPSLKNKKPKRAVWQVWLNGKLIDTVFMDSDMSGDDIKRGLVKHDGYNPNIKLKKEVR